MPDSNKHASTPNSQTPPTASADFLPPVAAGNMRPAEDREASFDDYEELTPEIAEEEAIRNDFVIRWAVVLLGFLLASTRIWETPTLVHIKTGQYLASHGFLPPANDVFSYTANDRPWTNLSWGFDLIVSAIYSMGGFTALSVMKALVFAFIFWILGRISRPGSPTWWGSICGALALLGVYLKMPAQPQIVTYLGLAITLWLIFSWREALDKPKRLWLFIPLMFVWCNTDPRAFLGWSLMLLYALGDSLGAWVGSPTALPANARKHLWKVAVSGVGVTLLHPFWWKSLISPWLLYMVDYPAVRDYVTEAVLEPVNARVIENFTFFSIMTEGFWTWKNLSYPILSSLAVIFCGLMSFVLNRSKFDWGYLAVFLGFVLFAVACLFELPAAGIAAAVIATLNGQAWYAEKCRQTYSVETGELLFSRGGRAITVLTLAAIGFFAGTGKLVESSNATPGYGLDTRLSVDLADLEKLLSEKDNFDDKPFNTMLSQGDMLIWNGQKVFCDNRVGIYYVEEDDDANLLRQQILARDSLRGARRTESSSPSAASRAEHWRKTFDEYGVTHVVVRMVSDRDLTILEELLTHERQWEWTGLGASAGVFYRTTAKIADQEAYKKFLEEHYIDFRKLAYDDQLAEADTDELRSGRMRSIRPRSFYRKYFWSRRIESNAEVREAMQLVKLALSGLPPRLAAGRIGMIYLAIRKAQVGLAKNPDDPDGYIALAQAYELLATIEERVSVGVRQKRNGLRYLQAIAAYTQALVGEPENIEAHRRLLVLYLNSNKIDLAFRHLSAIDEDILNNPDKYSDETAKTVGAQINELNKRLKEIDEANPQIASAPGVDPAADTNMTKRLQGYLEKGCFGRALEVLESTGKQMTGDQRLELLRLQLLLENGRLEDAYENAMRVASVAEMKAVSSWADSVGPICVAQGDYEKAASYWNAASDEIRRDAISRIINTLPPHANDGAAPWPLTSTTNLMAYFFQYPETAAGMKLNAALSLLESGRIKKAEEAFREVLEISPDSILRPFIVFYIAELTRGTDIIDIVPPSDRIVEIFADEPTDKPTGAAVPADKPTE